MAFRRTGLLSQPIELHELVCDVCGRTILKADGTRDDILPHFDIRLCAQGPIDKLRPFWHVCSIGCLQSWAQSAKDPGLYELGG